MQQILPKNGFASALIAIVLLASAACTHTTRISVKPDDAKIYINDRYAGTGHGQARIDNAMSGSFDLRLESPTAGTLDASVPREQVNWPLIFGAAMGGLAVDGVGCLMMFSNGPITSNPLYYPGMLVSASGCLSLTAYGWSLMPPDTIQVDMNDKTFRVNPDYVKAEAKLLWHGAGGASSDWRGRRASDAQDRDADAYNDAKSELESGEESDTEDNSGGIIKRHKSRDDKKSKTKKSRADSDDELSPAHPAFDKPFTY